MNAALCTDCAALVINGQLCHEHGCPAEARARRDLRARTCGECGTIHDEPEHAAECCAPVEDLPECPDCGAPFPGSACGCGA